jgi:hypothetical protein
MPNYISNFINDEFPQIFRLDDKQQIGIAGFYMMAVARQGYLKSTTVPVIPLENGSYAVDHIIQNPLVIEMEGSVADIWESPSLLQNTYVRALAEIGNVDQYLPDYTRQQINQINAFIQDGQNIIRQLDSYINSGAQLIDIFSVNSEAVGIVERFENLMNSLIDTDQVIPIQLRNKVYQNMTITNFQVVQPHEFETAIEFRVTAVQLRYAQTLFKASNLYNNPSASVANQTAKNDNRGINKSIEVPQSVFHSVLNGAQ